MTAFYGRDLAHVHDAAFGAIAEVGAATFVRRARRLGGLVVDLGCGSGITARRLVDAGYDVLGIDASADLLALAEERASRRRASSTRPRSTPCFPRASRCSRSARW